MPLSWPYGVTGPVVGQMFHVKHWLWCRWRRGCSGRRVCSVGPGCAVGGGPPASRPLSVVCPVGLVAVSAGLLCVPVGGGPPASRPRRELRSARRLEARPGPATAHGHRSQALMPPTGPPPVIQNAQLACESPVIRGYAERYTFSTDLSRHFPPISVSRPLAAQPGPGRGQTSSCPLRCVAVLYLWARRPGQQPWNIPVVTRWSSATWGSGASCP